MQGWFAVVLACLGLSLAVIAGAIWLVNGKRRG